MKKKEFTGWVDGHYVSGAIVEKDDEDCKQEIEEEAKALKTAAKVIGGIALGAIIIAVVAAGSEEGGK